MNTIDCSSIVFVLGSLAHDSSPPNEPARRLGHGHQSDPKKPESDSGGLRSRFQPDLREHARTGSEKPYPGQVG